MKNNTNMIKSLTDGYSERNNAISLARMVAMFFIVICHFFQYYDIELAWWFNVGVQMFFLISGFLYGNKKNYFSLEFYSKNIKKILIPYYCFLFPAIIIYFLFDRECITIGESIHAILLSDTLVGLGHFWFIPYILFCYLITPFLRLITNEALKKKKLSFMLLSLFEILLFGQIIFREFNVYFGFSNIFAYICGFYLAKIYIEYGNSNLKRLTYVLSVMCVLLNGIRAYIKYFDGRRFLGFSYFEQYSHVLLGISIFLLIFLVFKDIKAYRFLKLSDKYSYYIYIVHQFFILSPFSLMKITGITYLNWVIVIVAICVSAIILKVVSDAVRNFITKQNIFR